MRIFLVSGSATRMHCESEDREIVSEKIERERKRKRRGRVETHLLDDVGRELLD